VAIIVAVVAVDQVTKIWAVAQLTGKAPIEVLGTFFQLTLVYNEGGAMGTRLGPSLSYLIVALVILPVLLFYIYRNLQTRIVAIPLAFIAAGAIGNLIDRIRIGKVIDFLDFDFFDIEFLSLQRFWAFNIADAAISCAIVFLLIYMFLPQSRDTLQPSSPNQTPANTDSEMPRS